MAILVLQRRNNFEFRCLHDISTSSSSAWHVEWTGTARKRLEMVACHWRWNSNKNSDIPTFCCFWNQKSPFVFVQKEPFPTTCFFLSSQPALKRQRAFSQPRCGASPRFFWIRHEISRSVRKWEQTQHEKWEVWWSLWTSNGWVLKFMVPTGTGYDPPGNASSKSRRMSAKPEWDLWAIVFGARLIN